MSNPPSVQTECRITVETILGHADLLLALDGIRAVSFTLSTTPLIKQKNNPVGNTLETFPTLNPDSPLCLQQQTNRIKQSLPSLNDDLLHQLLKSIAAISSLQWTNQAPLALRGTSFQIAVWGALQSIPCGETASYLSLARKIGRPTATRAVARACASNKIAFFIPCHRVIRSDGQLGGYRWGLERKALLLNWEASQNSINNQSSINSKINEHAEQNTLHQTTNSDRKACNSVK